MSARAQQLALDAALVDIPRELAAAQEEIRDYGHIGHGHERNRPSDGALRRSRIENGVASGNHAEHVCGEDQAA